MRYLFFFFILLPFVEIYILIVAGNYIGAFNAILLIVLTGIIGLYLLRNQGIRSLINLRSNPKGFDPTADNILKTLFTPIGGFLILIPGFVTDFLGLLILLPLTRIFLIGIIFSYIGSLNNNPMNKKTNEDWIEGEYKKDK
ncbi:MAG: FxsA family protein [Gammaproteobacteria bacterium]|nr:MAG: FxsA family protein [Gammaproteobacteria bacterium]